MELWIRSQNKKTLVKSDYIIIMWFPFHYSIVGYLNGKIKHKILGSYKTKERAIEVLDEIQSLLQPTIEYKPIVQEEYNPAYTYKHFVKVDDNIEIKELSTFVYQMPEK